MNKYCRITPEGTRDYVFDECILRRELEHQVAALFSRRGFTEVVTPEIEFMDVFTLPSCHIPEEGMYKLTDRKGRLIALRPDSTMPIARLVSTRMKDFPVPIRLFYNQKVYHATPSLAGKSDEELQSGIEIIGVSGVRADLEAVSLAVETLEACNPSDYRLELGHIAIFNRLIEKYQIDGELGEEIRSLIEMKNYPALNDLLDSALPEPAAFAFKQLPRLFGGDEIFDQAIRVLDDPEITKIIGYLRDLYFALEQLGLQDKVSVDLGLVNQAHYYTGVLFRGYISGFGQAVLSGGRYDRLFAEFGLSHPAIGFGINLDAVLASVMENRPKTLSASSEVLVFAEKGYEVQGLLYIRERLKDNGVAEYSAFETLEEALSYGKQKGVSEIAVVSETVRIIRVEEENKA